MHFYTVCTKKEGALALPNNLFVEKQDYDAARTRALMSYVKHFYIRIDVESEDTDFNDRYSHSSTRLVPCNAENLIVKDGEPYGFIAYGLERFERPFIVLTEENPKAWDGEHSGYSSLDRDFYLKRYECKEAVMELAARYRLVTVTKDYKIKDGHIMKKSETVSERVKYFTAFDVENEDGAYVLKDERITYRVPDEENEIKETVEDRVLGVVPYRAYRTFRLEKIWEA